MLETIAVKNIPTLDERSPMLSASDVKPNSSVTPMQLFRSRPIAFKQSHQKTNDPTVLLLQENGFSFYLANDESARMQALQLTKREYLRQGLLAKESMKMFDDTARSSAYRTLLARDHKGEAAGTVTLCIDGPGGLPSDEIFCTEVAQQRASKCRLVEVSKFAINHKRRRSKSLLLNLINLLYVLTAKSWGATDLIIEVHPRHAAFYKRLLGFRPLGKVRSCPRVCGKPAELLIVGLDVYEKEAGVPRKDGRRSLYPAFMSPAAEQEVLRKLEGSQR